MLCLTEIYNSLPVSREHCWNEGEYEFQLSHQLNEMKSFWVVIHVRKEWISSIFFLSVAIS
jgi:hypothetical protein